MEISLTWLLRNNTNSENYIIPWETLNTLDKCKISPFSVNVKQTLCPNIWLNYSFEAGSKNQIGGWSYIERSEHSCIRNRSGVGRAERGLVSRKNGGRSGRAGFERGWIRDTARIQRALIGDRYALQSERVIFNPIIPDQAIKIGRHWSGVGRLSGVNVALLIITIHRISQQIL